MSNPITDYYNYYLPSDSVPRLYAKNFKPCGNISDTSDQSIVFFYIPECRECQGFAPEIANFSDNYASLAKCTVYAVDMSYGDNYKLKNMSTRFNYRVGDYYPMLVIYSKGSACSIYSDERSASGIYEYLKQKNSCEFKFEECDD